MAWRGEKADNERMRGEHPKRPGLIRLLRARADEVAEASLRHFELAMPGLADLDGRVRQAGLDAMRHSIGLRLDLAEREREATRDEEAYLRAYFLDAAERGIPLDVQLQIVRRTIAFWIHDCWQFAGPEHTAELLVLSARTSRFHQRMEQLLVDAYCQRLGSDVAADRLRTAHADALLVGGVSAPVDDAPRTSAVGYLVVVIPGNTASPAPLGALSGDPHLLHTVRDGADVVLVPTEPDGREVAEKIALRSRDLGRTSAVAVVAGAPDAVPQAYAAAVRLLEVAPALRAPPVLTMLQDALPERLLAADSAAAAELLELISLLAGSPGLIETLTAFLDADLDRSATAERLHIHRRTLTQRLHRIRELTGYDPRGSRGVQVLGLAIAAHRLSQP